MVLGSHNSWSYLRPKAWWLRPIRFIAKCQDADILNQYGEYNVRCFDLRVRFVDNKLVVAHGIFQYDIDEKKVYETLDWLDKCGDIYVRVIHEARKAKYHTPESVALFADFCSYIENRYKNIKFWCGKNLYDWTNDYTFRNNPSCEEKYSSVCTPKLIDDWYPRWFALRNNRKILKEGTDKDILLIDFVNIR